MPPLFAAADVLCALGLGVLLAMGYDLCRTVLGNGRLVTFWLDILAAFLSAVLLYSFAAGRSFSGQLRWYMTAGFLAGLFSSFSVLAPATQAVRTALLWVFSRPFVLVWICLVRPLGRLLGRAFQSQRYKMRQMALKRRKKQLKKAARVLYNSNN